MIGPSFRRLLGEIRPHTKRVVIVAVTGVLFAVAYARLVMIIKDIQESFEHGSPQMVAQVGAWAVGLALLVAVSRYFHIFTMNYIAELVVSGMRLKLQAKFMRLNLAFHNNYGSGSGGLISRIFNDIKVIQDGLRMVADFFREPLLAILLFANLLYLNWRLTLVLLVIVPPILYFLRQISKSLRKYVEWGQTHLEQMTSTVKETLDGVRTIQSFNLESLLAKKLEQESESYLELRKKVHARVELMGPVVELVAAIMILSVFFYFSSLVAEGKSSTGAVLAYIASIMAINQPLKKLQESYVRIQETLVASQRVFAMLDENFEVPENPHPKAFPYNWKEIHFDKVRLSLGGVEVLAGIDFRVKRGEQVALVGESGSGKTTLLNLLGRFYDPDSGAVKIDGIDLREFSLAELRSQIALVSQDVFLFRDSLEKNILAGRPLDQTKLREAAEKSHAASFILPLKDGFAAQVGERGALLSGGERQRLAIARAIYKDAPILLLDEATSALDSASEREVQAGLESLALGRTALMVAHRLSTIQHADRILVLKKGRVVEEGSHSQLIDRGGEYFRFHQMQSLL